MMATFGGKLTGSHVSWPWTLCAKKLLRAFLLICSNIW